VSTKFQIQVSAETWAGCASNGRWVPAIDGTVNQTLMPAQEASTFDTREEAEAELAQLAKWADEENSEAKFRVEEVDEEIRLTPDEQAALTWLLRDEERRRRGGRGYGYVAPTHRLRPYFEALAKKGLVELLPGCKDSFGFGATPAGRDWRQP